MAEYRVDDLARAASTTVRNVRAYQERRLLPRPRIDGRVAIYDDTHLARLRLIGHLLERGYTLSQIEELLAAFAAGRDLADVLGLETQVLKPWSEEEAEIISTAELERRWGRPLSEAQVQRLGDSGLAMIQAKQLRLPSPRLIAVGSALLEAGMSVDSVIALAGDVNRLADTMAGTILGTVVPEVFPHDRGGLAATVDVAERSRLIERLRPLAQSAVEAALALAMERHSRELIETVLQSSLPDAPPD